MPSKHRKYSIVIHNVHKNSQDKVRQYASQAQDFIMSVEPNPQGDGFHAHMFLKYRNPRSFKSQLNELERFKTSIVVPRPEGETRDWGRVQLDVMRGSWDQCLAYLKGETKDKPTGEVLSQKTKPCWRRQRYTKEIGDRKNIEEFCGRCHSSSCPGCCPGCEKCEPEKIFSQAIISIKDAN